MERQYGRTLVTLLVSVSMAIGYFVSTPIEAAAQDGTGSVAGTVTDAATGLPIEGISVTPINATIVSALPTATSASDGTFLIEGLAPNDYWFRFADAIAPIKYAFEYYDGVIDPVLSQSVQVVANGVATVNASLEPASSISGTVVDSSLQPVIGLWVSAYAVADTGDRLFYVGSVPAGWVGRPDGKYLIQGLRGGSYLVQVGINEFLSPDLTWASGWYDGAPTLVGATSVVVAPGGTTPGIDFVVVEGGIVRGTVTDGVTGAPIANICVTPRDPRGLQVPSPLTPTASDGTYELTNLPAGPLDIEFWDCSGLGYEWVTTYRVTPVAGAIVQLDVALFPEPTRFVALGDSFSSGTGTGDYYPSTNEYRNRCRRSVGTWTQSLFDQPGELGETFENWACHGAQTFNLYTTEPSLTEIPWDDPVRTDYRNAPWRITSSKSYLDRLGPDVRTVTLTIGGNDIGFADILEECLRVACENGSFLNILSPLNSALVGNDGSGGIYAEVRQRAPNATNIIVSGYPNMFGDSSDWFLNQCDFVFGSIFGLDGVVRRAEADWMRGLARSLNDRLEQLVLESNASDALKDYPKITFVDVNDMFSDDLLCDPPPGTDGDLLNPDSVFLHDIQFTRRWESFHPTALGYERWADVVSVALSSVGTGATRTVITSGATIDLVFIQVREVGTVLRVLTTWPGSDVKTTLISPSGQRYNRDNLGGPSHSLTETSEWIEIEADEVGEWTIEIHGLDVPASGELVEVSTAVLLPPNVPPVAIGTKDRTVVEPAVPVWFDASDSYDADGTVVSHEWFLGDGTLFEGEVLSYAYDRPGLYEVSLRVTDDDGATSWINVGSIAVCNQLGTAQVDVLVGGAGDDVICGLGGNDKLIGGGGNDLLIGGPGKDRLIGGDGDDILYGGSEDDRLIGGDGDDHLFGDEGDDYLHGGDDDDLLVGGPGTDVLKGGSGNNTTFE